MMFAPLPERRYDIILADPPWLYRSDTRSSIAAAKKYPCLSTDDLARLPVRNIASRPSVLFLWATCPKLDEAISLMRRWGFHYRGVAYIWVKTKADGSPMGAKGVRPTFVKPASEMVLVGATERTGRVFPLLTEKQRQVLLAPVVRHSAKPPEVRSRIVELLGDRPRIELFARDACAGWDCWGNEAPSEAE